MSNSRSPPSRSRRRHRRRRARFTPPTASGTTRRRIQPNRARPHVVGSRPPPRRPPRRRRGRANSSSRSRVRTQQSRGARDVDDSIRLDLDWLHGSVRQVENIPNLALRVGSGCVLWDADTGRDVHTTQLSSPNLRAVLSFPTSEKIAISHMSQPFDISLVSSEIGGASPLALRGLCRGHRDSVLRLAFLGEDDLERFVSTSHDGTMRLWNVDSDGSTKEIGIYLTDRGNKLKCVGVDDSGSLRLWTSGYGSFKMEVVQVAEGELTRVTDFRCGSSPRTDIIVHHSGLVFSAQLTTNCPIFSSSTFEKVGSFQALGGGIYCLLTSPANPNVFYGGCQDRVAIYDVRKLPAPVRQVDVGTTARVMSLDVMYDESSGTSSNDYLFAWCGSGKHGSIQADGKVRSVIQESGKYMYGCSAMVSLAHRAGGMILMRLQDLNERIRWICDRSSEGVLAIRAEFVNGEIFVARWSLPY